MPMIKWLFIGLFFSISLSLLFISVVGIQPRAQKIIDPSHYQNLQHMGYSIYQRLNQDINKSSVIILGSSNEINNSTNVWEGLFLAEEKYQSSPKVLINYNSSNSFKNKLNFIETYNINDESKLLVIIKDLLAKKLKIIVNTTDEIASYFDEKSITRKLIQSVKSRPFSLTQGLFAVNANEFKDGSKCNKNTPKSVRVCKSIEASRKYFKNKYSPNELRAVVEKHGANDYLLFIHQPQLN